MHGRPSLETKIADLANKFCFVGIGIASIAFVGFVFNPRGGDWPLDPASVALFVLFSIGCTSLACGRLTIRKLVGFGSIEPPPITLPRDVTP